MSRLRRLLRWTGRRALIIIAVALFLGAAARDRFDAWVDATELPSLVAETSVEVLDRNGSLLRAYTVSDGRWRLRLELDQTDPLFLAMLLAYEDKRFYRHSGVDPLAVARAGWQLISTGHLVSGGSTLTMQVARLLEDGSTGEWSGKLRQTRLALALERHLTKAEILTLYLNRAPYGGNLEGLRAASRAYFAKDPRRLTPAQAALLVALPQSPERRRPDRFPEAAKAARDRVLMRMQAAGVIDAETLAAALREKIPDRRRDFPALAPHLADRALAEAPQTLVHRLTIDAEVQKKLERLAERVTREAGDRISIAIVAADHVTGEVLASVGSAGYRDDRAGYVDMTRALRSPGSTLKPFIYGLAFEMGLAHPQTLIEDRPTAFGTYAPQNFDGQFRGTVTVHDALQMSLNIPAVMLTDAISPDRLVAYMRSAGTRPVVPGGRPGLAVALGGVGVTLEDLVQLYAGLAEDGRGVGLHHRLGQSCPLCGRRLMRAESAWQVSDILAGMPPPAGAPPDRVAYKTGTSYGHRDTWAIGFDGRHVIGVWMGRPDGTPVPGQFGGGLAAPVLFEAFSRLKPGLDPLPPPPPGTLIVGNGGLPQPLRNFRPRDALFRPDADAPAVAFPPDGAVLSAEGGHLVVKVRDGRAPFTWLADGRPLATAERDREVAVTLPGKGFVTLSVIDALGRSAVSKIQVN
ncbi:penicillin-binding protein 1C [Frigidibacter sp. ROC022]|uniref:penicillin-binding protein 1C n=1 Tax=Frigidibacter sp. ROC022 TaxID=2971796 RepID=UPI00215A58F2|nr:penicillin-binding protein 1C [Frigidibacter sp. ROC022]MCR8724720.1 penicillin-binding protein 1C [Frigidibacter sp. ROC022]